MSAYRERPVLIAIIGATSAIIAAFAKPICSTLLSPSDVPASRAVAVAGPDAVRKPLAPDQGITPTPALTPSIEGAWKQYVVLPDQAVYLGTFVVSRLRGEFVISPRTQNEGPEFVNTLAVFDVAYDGETWSFNSNWGGGQVGNFELHRMSPTVFEGDIRIAGQFSNRTRWVKME